MDPRVKRTLSTGVQGAVGAGVEAVTVPWWVTAAEL